MLFPFLDLTKKKKKKQKEIGLKPERAIYVKGELEKKRKRKKVREPTRLKIRKGNLGKN